jgi:hypothetical protein
MSVMGASNWPHLKSLYRGYLHQDFTAEHGSADNAVQAWLADAGVDNARELSAEWRNFLNVTYGMDLEARTHALRELVGGSWAPSDEREFDVVSARLLKAGQV